MSDSCALSPAAITRLETGQILTYSVCLKVILADELRAQGMQRVPGGNG